MNNWWGKKGRRKIPKVKERERTMNREKWGNRMLGSGARVSCAGLCRLEGHVVHEDGERYPLRPHVTISFTRGLDKRLLWEKKTKRKKNDKLELRRGERGVRFWFQFFLPKP